MSQTLSLKNPLQSVLLKTSSKNYGRYAVLYFVGLVLLTLSSKINIPLQPVPVTLQTLAVLFIGMIYGPRLGTATVTSFVVLGLLGAPLLAGPLMGPSMGYLIGFIPAAFFAGILVQRGWGKSIIGTALAALVGMFFIYSCGLMVLAAYVGGAAAIKLGLMPFILPALVKLAVLAFIVPRFWKA